MIDWVEVGRRIRSLRKARGLSQVEFGEPLGVTNAAVSNWENGKGLTTDRVFEIKDAYDLPSVDILLSDSGNLEHNKNTESANVKPLRGVVVPRYSFEQAKVRDRSLGYVDQVRSHFPCSSDSFALIIEDRANADRFLPGDSVIIDPEIPHEPEDMVFAYVGEEQKPVFRRYEVNDPHHYTLRALNNSFPSYPIGPGDRAVIIGVMSEHTAPRRV